MTRAPPIQRQVSESENLPSLIEEKAVITATITSTHSESTTATVKVQEALTERKNSRRRSVKRQNSDDESSLQQNIKVFFRPFDP